MMKKSPLLNTPLLNTSANTLSVSHPSNASNGLIRGVYTVLQWVGKAYWLTPVVTVQHASVGITPPLAKPLVGNTVLVSSLRAVVKCHSLFRSRLAACQALAAPTVVVLPLHYPVQCGSEPPPQISSVKVKQPALAIVSRLKQATQTMLLPVKWPLLPMGAAPDVVKTQARQVLQQQQDKQAKTSKALSADWQLQGVYGPVHTARFNTLACHPAGFLLGIPKQSVSALDSSNLDLTNSESEITLPPATDTLPTDKPKWAVRVVEGVSGKAQLLWMTAEGAIAC
jgi:hypothetical protein